MCVRSLLAAGNYHTSFIIKEKCCNPWFGVVLPTLCDLHWKMDTQITMKEFSSFLYVCTIFIHYKNFLKLLVKKIIPDERIHGFCGVVLSLALKSQLPFRSSTRWQQVSLPGDRERAVLGSRSRSISSHRTGLSQNQLALSHSTAETQGSHILAAQATEFKTDCSKKMYSSHFGSLIHILFLLLNY